MFICSWPNKTGRELLKIDIYSNACNSVHGDETHHSVNSRCCSCAATFLHHSSPLFILWAYKKCRLHLINASGLRQNCRWFSPSTIMQTPHNNMMNAEKYRGLMARHIFGISAFYMHLHFCTSLLNGKRDGHV